MILINSYRHAIVGAVLEDLNFTTVVGLTNTIGVWAGTLGGAFANYGLASKRLASGQDGYIQARYTATDGQAAILGFNTTNSNQRYPDFEAGAYVNTDHTIYYVNNGAVSGTGGPGLLSVGDYFRIIRTGSVLKIQKSADANTWSDAHTYAFSSTADLYINLNINSTNKCYNPKGYNLT